MVIPAQGISTPVLDMPPQDEPPVQPDPVAVPFVPPPRVFDAFPFGAMKAEDGTITGLAYDALVYVNGEYKQMPFVLDRHERGFEQVVELLRLYDLAVKGKEEAEFRLLQLGEENEKLVSQLAHLDRGKKR